MYENNSYERLHSHSPVSARSGVGATSVVVHSPPQVRSHIQTEIVPPRDASPTFVAPIPHVKRYGKNIIDNNAFVSYHVDEETGGIIETSISPNKNHVTARSVNSPTEVSRTFGHELNRFEQPEQAMPRRSEYIPTTLRGDEPYLSASVRPPPYVIAGNDIHHPKIYGRLSDYALSDTEVSRRRPPPPEMEYYIRENHRSDGTSSRDRRSPRGSPRLGRTKRPTRAEELRRTSSPRFYRRAGSAYSLDSSSTAKDGRASPKVKRFPKNLSKLIKWDSSDKGGHKHLRRVASLDGGDGELRGKGPTDRHVVSSLFVTVPGSGKPEDDLSIKDSKKREKKRRDHKEKEKRGLPRHGESLDSLKKVYMPQEYVDALPNWKMEDGPYGDVMYVDAEGQLYVQRGKEYYPYNGNYMYYPSMEYYNDAEMLNGFEDIDLNSSSHGESSDDEVAYLNGKHRIRNYTKPRRRRDRYIKENIALSSRDFKEPVPIYTHRRPRSVSPRHHRSLRRRASKRYQQRPVKERSSSYSDDIDIDNRARENQYEDQTIQSRTSSQLRQKRPDVVAGTTEVNVTGSNENPPGFTPQHPVDTNFALFPGATMPQTVPNPYSGFPYSLTPGHMDQLLRNTSLNLASMRSYVDAMSSSLAHMPSPTISNLPYRQMQPVEHYGLDTLDNVETQDFFQHGNISSGQHPVSVIRPPTYDRPDQVPTTMAQRLHRSVDPNPAIVDYLVDSKVTQPRHQMKTNTLPNERTEAAKKQNFPDIYPKHVRDIDSNGHVATQSAFSTPSHQGHGVPHTASNHIDAVIDSGPHVKASVSRVKAYNYDNGTSSSNMSNKPEITGRHLATTSLPNISSAQKVRKNSAVQTDFDNLQKRRDPESTLRLGFSLQRLTSKDSQTQTKSPPPATLPKPKRFDRQTSKGPLSPTSPTSRSDVLVPNHQTPQEVSHNDKVTSPTRQHDHDNGDDAYAQSLGPNYFFIRNVRVMDSMDNQTNSHVDKNSKRPLKISAEYSVDKHSVTQTNYPYSPHVKTVIHPEADYDVYPRKPLINSGPSSPFIQIDRPETVTGYHPDETSPTSVHPDSPVTKRKQLGALSPKPQTNPYTFPKHADLNSFSSPPMSPRETFSLPRQSSNHSNFNRTITHSSAVPRDAFDSQSPSSDSPRGIPSSPFQSLQSQKGAFRSPSHTPAMLNRSFHTPPQSPRSPNIISAQSVEPVRTNMSNSNAPGSSKVEETSTDFRNSAYQIYRGDRTLQSQSSRDTSYRLTSPTNFSESREIITNGPSSLGGNELENDFRDTGYTLYKGRHVGSLKLSEAEATPISTLYRESRKDPKPPVEVAKPLKPPSIVKEDKEVRRARSPRGTSPGVPIPLRDFDSDADSSDYIYTSRGWSHMSGTSKNATVMSCIQVKDNSAKYMSQMYDKTQKSKDFHNSVLDTFLTGVPNYKGKSSSMDSDGGKFWDIMSVGSHSRKLDSLLDFSEMFSSDNVLPFKLENHDCPWDFLNHTTSLDKKSVSMDPGVSLAFLKDNCSLTYLDSCSSDHLVVPKTEKYNHASNISNSSGGLGWDFKSCNEKAEEIAGYEDRVFMKEHFEQKLDSEARRIQRHAAIRLQTYIRMFIVYNRHQKMRKTLLRIQRMVRMWKTRREFKTLRNGIILAQAQYRMYRQRRRYIKTREEIRQRLEEHKIARRKQEAQERIERERRPTGVMINRRISQLLMKDVAPDYDENNVRDNAVVTPIGEVIQRERAAQMMASIANLDIPGELALVYSKIDEWELYHDGNHIITAVGDVRPMDMGYKLPVDINSHAFSKYTSVYFKNPNWGVQMDPIRTTLTPVQGDENVMRALGVFKLILRFMCDTRMNEKKEKILSDFIVQLGLKYEGIRDEILCQLANQTWLNQNVERAERAWRLLANCLCCFNPSPTLFKYLLKYVSDVGYNGYKTICQHKVLQSAYMDPLLSRVYPPTFLEWRAIQRKANMALEVKFPDDINVIGHVESWTSGELFTSHLLKMRGLHENAQGWTLQLQEDTDFYELMGYDYVLDLISEIEIVPGFPTCTAYFLVSVDRSRERARHRRHGHAEGPHNPEKERVLVLAGPLPEMIKRDIPIATSSTHDVPINTSSHADQTTYQVSRKRITKTNSGEDELGFSTTSVLNQRPTEILPTGLSESSILNTRYTKRSRAPGPPVMNGHVPNGISTIVEDDENNHDLSDLSRNKLNVRYFPNGDISMVDTKDLSHSKLNNRYNKKSKAGRGVSGVSAQITRKSVHSRDDMSEAKSDHTDWSVVVDDIFNSALDEHDEQDGRMLGSRIKGGGKGVPGFQQPQPLSQPLGVNYGLTNTSLGLTQPVVPPLNFTSPSVPSYGLNTGIDPLQQVAAQQMAQQQAVLQAYLSQQRQQEQQQALLQQQQAQQAAQQAQHALQASHQQTEALKTALQQQEMQNKLLKQSIEQEALRKQLRDLQYQQPVVPPPVPHVPVMAPIANQYAGGFSPDSSFSGSYTGLANNAVNTSFNNIGFNRPTASTSWAAQNNVTAVPVVNGVPPVRQSSTEADSRDKRVSFIKSNFENQDSGPTSPAAKGPPATAPKMPRTQFQFQVPQTNNTSNVTRTITVKSTSTIDVPVKPPSPPPPPPPTQYEGIPPLHTQPAVPPAPPPPPPSPPPAIQIDKDKGTFTIRDRSGRARTVRIGKVVWPPPQEHQAKHDIQVGKLEIDEHVASGIENRITGKRKWQKPEPPKQDDGQPRSILKSSDDDKKERITRKKSLVETEHYNTMKLLEQKLGGGGAAAAPPTPAPAPAPVRLPPKQLVSEGTETEDANIYATAIVADDQPPPVPKSIPPKLTTTKKTVTETLETMEIKRTASGDYKRRIERDSMDGGYAKRIEPVPAPVPIRAPSPPPQPEPDNKPQIDYAAFERVITELYPQNKKFFLMYNNVPWILRVRKEVFWPSEKLENPTALHLIYCQIVNDVYNNGCIRITKDQRVKMRGLLESHGINQYNYLTRELKPQIKKVIVDTAKEWPTYFCRLFPVAASGHYSGVKYLGVSHTGLRLITRERSFVDDYLSVLEDIKFEDVINVVLPTSSTLQLNLRTKSLIFHTTRAQQLKDMIDRFCHESEKGNKYVVAVKDYITKESTLLSFRRGDIIKLMDPEMDLESGWLYGSMNGIVGLFPADNVKPLARHEVETSSSKPVLYKSKMANGYAANGDMANGSMVNGGMVNGGVSGGGMTNGVITTRQDSRSPDDRSDTSQGTIVQDGKYSMMEYAMMHFRESLEKYEMLRTDDGSIRGTVKMMENAKLQNMKTKESTAKKGGTDWSWKEQADLIKWTRSPIQASLLKFSSSDLNKLALECFIAIMRFMGDYPMGTNMTEFDCAKKILKTCHKYPQLRDEIFCQLCKQTTNNRSMFSKSKIRGWRLFALVAAYFDCSDSLRPYLFKYLETTATDAGRTYNNAAALCLHNLRKTFKYGGRKDVPLREEVVALADGRNCKRFPFFYSGADTHEGMLQVKSCTVVQDAIEEICLGLNIADTVEMEEYTFFVRTRDGTFSKLNREDYILDETAYYVRRQIPYDLIFQRTVWYFPLKHMDNDIYVDMMFHQTVLDYIEGFLVTLPQGRLPRETANDVAYLGAILHRANKMVGTPTMKDLEALVPRNIRNMADSRPQQWLNKIHENLGQAARMTSFEAKTRFIDVLKRWPLFGSTFFLIKSIPNVGGESMLAVNHQGIAFLRKDTQETLMQHPFSEILSTRRYRSDSNVNYLDMKLGNLMVQQILRIETDQGSDISDLIGQYMQVINRHRKRQDKPSPNGHQ